MKDSGQMIIPNEQAAKTAVCTNGPAERSVSLVARGPPAVDYCDGSRSIG